ncbi:MAG: hypothetical protein HYX97_06785 [Chloroflexi bacterium]|nr:hypothetical protein [Chloroflexota bacterium]
MLLWAAASVATFSFLIWVYLVWFRGFFWRFNPRLALGPVDIGALSEWPSVGVVIPARNEAPLLAQTLPTAL